MKNELKKMVSDFGMVPILATENFDFIVKNGIPLYLITYIVPTISSFNFLNELTYILFLFSGMIYVLPERSTYNYHIIDSIPL